MRPCGMKPRGASFMYAPQEKPAVLVSVFNVKLSFHVLSSDKEVNSNCRAAQRIAMPFCFFFAVQSLGCRPED